MPKVSIPYPELLHIPTGHGISYGLSQNWYSTSWRRQSGCGPTTAAAQFLYTARTNPAAAALFPEQEATPTTALALMDRVWNYITPSAFVGVSHLSKLEQGGVKYGRSREVALGYRALPVSPLGIFGRPTVPDMNGFLVPPLLAGYPVAFLGRSSGKVQGMESWHWVLLVGIEYGESFCYATVYNNGEQQNIDLSKWLQTTRLGGGFVFFQPGVPSVYAQGTESRQEQAMPVILSGTQPVEEQE